MSFRGGTKKIAPKCSKKKLCPPLRGAKKCFPSPHRESVNHVINTTFLTLAPVASLATGLASFEDGCQHKLLFRSCRGGFVVRGWCYCVGCYRGGTGAIVKVGGQRFEIKYVKVATNKFWTKNV